MPVLLFCVFILLPLAELYVIIQVGQAIGILPTLALLLVDGFIGAAVARSQGRTAWRRFNEAMGERRVPAREVMDGAMIIFGGALLLSPGFITDILGFALLIPPSRAILRGILKRIARRTPTGRPTVFVYERYGRGRAPGGASGTRGGSGGPGGSGGSGSGAGPRPRPGSPSWDVDGTAREVDDDDASLPSGEQAVDRPGGGGSA